MPEIVDTWEAEIRRIVFKTIPGKKLMRPYLDNTQYKEGLVEWLKWLSAYLASVRP
jgi:hypothetical protein